MKPLKRATKFAIALVVGVPLFYILSIVPAIWALQHDAISLRSFNALYRPLAPLAYSNAGSVLDWYAFRAMPYPSCGNGPSTTFLQHVAHDDAKAESTDALLIDVVSDSNGIRYFLNSRSVTPEQLKARLQMIAETFGTPRNGIFVRPNAETNFATLFSLFHLMREAGQSNFKLLEANQPEARRGGYQDSLIFSRGSFSSDFLPLYFPEHQPK